MTSTQIRSSVLSLAFLCIGSSNIYIPTLNSASQNFNPSICSYAQAAKGDSVLARNLLKQYQDTAKTLKNFKAYQALQTDVTKTLITQGHSMSEETRNKYCDLQKELHGTSVIEVLQTIKKTLQAKSPLSSSTEDQLKYVITYFQGYSALTQYEKEKLAQLKEQIKSSMLLPRNTSVPRSASGDEDDFIIVDSEPA